MNIVSSEIMLRIAKQHRHGQQPMDDMNTADIGSSGRSADAFDLATFFPYLVRVYYQAVSRSVASVYGPLYGLSVSEWRTMAVLGPRQALSATEIVARSSMDKVAVSRAIKRLRAAKLLKRDIDGDDRRRAVLRLTAKGVAVYEALVPRVLAVEDALLRGLSETERRTLIGLMARVRDNAADLPSADTAPDGNPSDLSP